MGLGSRMEIADRFATYVGELTKVIGHADREGPLRDYCSGLLATEGRLRGHMRRLRLRPEAIRLGPRRPGEEARGTFASEHRGLLVAAGVVESDPQESNHPATGRDQLTYR